MIMLILHMRKRVQSQQAAHGHRAWHVTTGFAKCSHVFSRLSQQMHRPFRAGAVICVFTVRLLHWGVTQGAPRMHETVLSSDPHEVSACRRKLPK